MSEFSLAQALIAVRGNPLDYARLFTSIPAYIHRSSSLPASARPFLLPQAAASHYGAATHRMEADGNVIDHGTSTMIIQMFGGPLLAPASPAIVSASYVTVCLIDLTLSDSGKPSIISNVAKSPIIGSTHDKWSSHPILLRVPSEPSPNTAILVETVHLIELLGARRKCRAYITPGWTLLPLGTPVPPSPASPPLASQLAAVVAGAGAGAGAGRGGKMELMLGSLYSPITHVEAGLARSTKISVKITSPTPTLAAHAAPLPVGASLALINNAGCVRMASDITRYLFRVGLAPAWSRAGATAVALMHDELALRAAAESWEKTRHRLPNNDRHDYSLLMVHFEKFLDAIFGFQEVVAIGHPLLMATSAENSSRYTKLTQFFTSAENTINIPVSRSSSRSFSRGRPPTPAPAPLSGTEPGLYTPFDASECIINLSNYITN